MPDPTIVAACVQAATVIADQSRGILTGGSGSNAILKWSGDFEYSYDEDHGKVKDSSGDSKGGMIIACKRDCALIGAEVRIHLKSRRTGERAEIFLETFYNGSAPNALLKSGGHIFPGQSTVRDGNNVMLVLVALP